MSLNEAVGSSYDQILALMVSFEPEDDDEGTARSQYVARPFHSHMVWRADDGVMDVCRAVRGK